MFIAEHEKRLYELIDEDISTKEKIKRSLSLLYSDAYYEKQLSIYREFLAISLTSNVDEMIEFSRACRERFLTIIDQIIDEAVLKGEIKAEARDMVGMLHTYSVGMVVESKVDDIDAKMHIDQFIEAFFTLIEKKDVK